MSQDSGVWRFIIRNYSFNGLKSYYVKGYDDTVLRVGFRRVDVVSPKAQSYNGAPVCAFNQY